MPFVRRPHTTWQLRTRALSLGERTLLMGVLNVTPDSFSDAGAFLAPEAALEHALGMLDEGADLIDIGGESTRPGAQTITAEEERERIVPVIQGILHQQPQTVLSVDTYHAATARAAIAAGAEIVNDVSGFAWDPEMSRTCADLHCGVILMHSRGRPGEWRTLPRLDPKEVVPLVRSSLAHSLDTALAAGVAPDRIVLDPGFGFGKVGDENYPLLAHFDDLLRLGQPLLAGLSRKSFLARILAAIETTGSAPRTPSDVPIHARDHATLAATTAAILAGASIVRVHEIRPALEAARVADAITGAA